MKHRPIERRTFLRGLGGVVIGLPFLEEMLATRAIAASAPAVIPSRAFNVFFGLGIPAPLQTEGFNGPLEPLRELADKLLILRGVDHVRADKPGDNAHYDGSIAAFTAEAPQGTAKAGGPSIDQVVRATRYPDGLPADMVPTLVAGTFFRRDRVSRHSKSFGPDGTVAASMMETPAQLFRRVFGDLQGAATDPRRDRIKRSVLDSVLDQADHYTGTHSPLGQSSKARLGEHLERLREFEVRAFKLEEEKANRQSQPPSPRESTIPRGDGADPGGEGIDITLHDLRQEWRLLADIYAFAIRTDRVRFGSITFCAAGERIRLKGDYTYNGSHVFTFDDGGQRKRGGAGGCSHEWWHDFDEKKQNEALRAHAHMKLQEVVYFLKLLDNADSQEANGRSILENSLFTLSTESGDGRHNDVKRELSGIFHAISGNGGLFKTGQSLDANCEGLDLYNTMLGAIGSKSLLGPEDRERRLVRGILA